MHNIAQLVICSSSHMAQQLHLNMSKTRHHWYRWALLHLEEFESAESAERTMSGHDENVEALSYRCMWLWGETDYVSSYDMCWCPRLHVDRPGYSNHRQSQLCQTLGGIYQTVTIDDSMKKTEAIFYLIVFPTHPCIGSTQSATGAATPVSFLVCLSMTFL